MPNIVLYTASVLIWGSTWFVVKLQLGVVHPLLSIAYRFGLAFLLLLVFCIVLKRLSFLKFTRRQHMFVALQGFFLFFVNYWLLYFGTFSLTSGLVAVCFSTITITNIINQRIFLGIPCSRRVAFASLLGLIGIICVFWHEVEHLSFRDTTLTGLLLCLAGTLSASFGNVVSFRNSRDGMAVMETAMLGMGYGAAFSLLMALVGGANLTFDPSPTYIWSLLYLALFGSVIAFGCYLTLMAKIGADRAAYTAVLFPIVALCISTLLEHYVWTDQALAGVGFIVAGNILAMIKKSPIRTKSAV